MRYNREVSKAGPFTFLGRDATMLIRVHPLIQSLYNSVVEFLSYEQAVGGSNPSGGIPQVAGIYKSHLTLVVKCAVGIVLPLGLKRAEQTNFFSMRVGFRFTET